jgi:hypothetical protein
MEEIFEAFPFIFGILLGLTWMRLGGPKAHRITWAIAAIGLGSLATFASGEWKLSPLYFLFDVALVAVVSVATLVGVQYLQRRWKSTQ